MLLHQKPKEKGTRSCFEFLPLSPPPSPQKLFQRSLHYESQRPKNTTLHPPHDAHTISSFPVKTIGKNPEITKNQHRTSKAEILCTPTSQSPPPYIEMPPSVSDTTVRRPLSPPFLHPMYNISILRKKTIHLKYISFCPSSASPTARGNQMAL